MGFAPVQVARGEGGGFFGGGPGVVEGCGVTELCTFRFDGFLVEGDESVEVGGVGGKVVRVDFEVGGFAPVRGAGAGGGLWGDRGTGDGRSSCRI